jgi:hypothetical protein
MNFLEKINILIAQSAFSIYKKVRYGIKDCKPKIDVALVADLRILHLRSVERMACNPTAAEALHLDEVNEKIATL